MNQTRRSEAVLAIYPTRRGFGYVVMHSPLSPSDWGVRGARANPKNATCLAKVSALIEAHQPDAIVMEDPTASGSNRPPRIKNLCLAIAKLADSQAIDVHVYPRSRVTEFFQQFGAKTRYEIAMVVSKQVAALERFLPSRRKLWESESSRMSIFNAVALAMTFFAAVAE